MHLNCGVRENKSWESLGLQGDQTHPLKGWIEYSLEGLMLKLKLQYFVHLMWRTDSFEQPLMLEKTEGGRRRGRQRTNGWTASPTQWTWIWVSPERWWRTGNPGVLKFMESQRIRHDLATEQQLDIKNKMVETTVLKFHCICLHAVWLSSHTHFPFLLSWKSSKV